MPRTASIGGSVQQVNGRQVAHGARDVAVGAGAERIGALQLEQVRYLVEQVGYLCVLLDAAAPLR